MSAEHDRGCRAARSLARECVAALEVRGLPVAIVTLERAPGEADFAVPVLLTAAGGRPILIECVAPHVSLRGRLARQLVRFGSAGFRRVPVRSVSELVARLGLGAEPRWG